MKSAELTLPIILERVNRLYPNKEIISRNYGETFKYYYSSFYRRVMQLANVLKQLGVQKGDRVGTLAWNNHRHLELYFGIPCTGAVLHTLNLRLSPDQLAYVINHAEDQIIFVDRDLIPILESIQYKLTTVKYFVVLSSHDELLPNTLDNVLAYEALLAEASDNFEYPEIDEWEPAAMCYTTATTGAPKGIMYTHRALILHCYAAALPDAVNISERDIVMPVVPMFHVNAWGLPFICTWLGSSQVLPGDRPQAEDICALIQENRVNIAAGVPTLWMATFPLWESGQYNHTSIREIVIGGAPVPKTMIQIYRDKLGVKILQGYGMTETAPLVLASRPKSYLNDKDEETKLCLAAKQGLLMPGLEMRVIDDSEAEVPWNGKTMGELLLRGPWIAREYYNDPIRSAQTFVDGWLHTGDIVTVDSEGYVAIADRSKDLIKSGGEWISSVDLENTIMAHPAVFEAAVIAMSHPKWGERPLACVVLKKDAEGKITDEDILSFLQGKVPKVWLPDHVEFIDAIPRTSVGKFMKTALRKRFVEEVAVAAESTDMNL